MRFVRKNDLRLADDINVRLCRMREKQFSCGVAAELFFAHFVRKHCLLTRQHLVIRPVQTPARLHYAISSVPLRTQPSGRLKAYQLSLKQYQKTYHNWKYAFGA